MGNPELVRNPIFFAYELLSEESRDADPPSFLEFSPQHLHSAQALLAWLLNLSPLGELLFTSDWQFGPKPLRRHDAVELPHFWGIRASRELRLNASYPIVRSKSTRL